MNEQTQEEKAQSQLSLLLRQAREQKVTGEVSLKLRLNAGGVRGIKTITEAEIPNK